MAGGIRVSGQPREVRRTKFHQYLPAVDARKGMNNRFDMDLNTTIQ